ncbi:MAG TPA: hypothetical protein VGQ24_15350 [Gemmatimonadales bacterium]|nr:hypothetical protein [Gemmatimonadales bacterium]
MRKPTFPARNERGIALALVLFGLVIMGAVLTGSFMAVRLDTNSATYATFAAEAQGAAEAGLAQVYANWDPTTHSVMPIWDGTTATEIGRDLHDLNAAAPDPFRQVADTVRRLNSQLFLVRAFGVRKGAGGQILAKLGVAQLFRISKPTIGVNAAVTVMDPLKLNGDAFVISGMNALPDQWSAAECDPLDPGNGDDLVGIRSATATGMTGSDADNVFGYPTADVPNDPSITDADFQDYLDYTYATLGAQPGVKLLPLSSTYNGVAPVLDISTLPPSCDKSAPLNFGEPWRTPPTVGAIPQCYGYFPVVHGTGGTTKFGAGNRGQGTLLVDGDLELTGDFEWLGLIIVKGAIKINGNGNKLTGAVFAQGVDILTAGAVSGNVDIQYSKCAVDKAVGGATLALPLGQRSFVQLY